MNILTPHWHISKPPAPPSQPYYDCRYAVLREPIGFPRGAEILEDDEEAIHAWVEHEGKVVAVGRAHLIPADSDGSAPDHAGPGATRCPSFGPLADSSNRPAIQIRQMGTRPEARRRDMLQQCSELLKMLQKSILVLKSDFYKPGKLPFHSICLKDGRSLMSRIRSKELALIGQ